MVLPQDPSTYAHRQRLAGSRWLGASASADGEGLGPDVALVPSTRGGEDVALLATLLQACHAGQVSITILGRRTVGAFYTFSYS